MEAGMCVCAIENNVINETRRLQQYADDKPVFSIQCDVYVV